MKLDKWLLGVKICAAVLWLECIVATYLPDETLDHMLQARTERREKAEGSQALESGPAAPEAAIAASMNTQGVSMLADLVCSREPDPKAARRGSGGLPAEGDDSSTDLISEPPADAGKATQRRQRARAKKR